MSSSTEALADMPRLQKNVELMKQAGIVPTTIDVQPYGDRSLAKEAAARIRIDPAQL